jgi:hypothetical protein
VSAKSAVHSPRTAVRSSLEVLLWRVVRVFRQPPVIATLTSIQSGVVSKLLGDYPRGRLERRQGAPTFVSKTATEVIEVDLVAMRITYLERRCWAALSKTS